MRARGLDATYRHVHVTGLAGILAAVHPPDRVREQKPCRSGMTRVTASTDPTTGSNSGSKVRASGRN
jgi:hypothetical protein